MSDFFDVQYYVGGDVSQAGMDALDGFDEVDEVSDEGVSPRMFRFEEARNGEDADFEALLKEHKISYQKYCGGDSRYSPYVEWWNPGMDEPQQECVNNNHEVVISHIKLAEWNSTGAATLLLNVRDFLDRDVPKDLPPLRVVE